MFLYEVYKRCSFELQSQSLREWLEGKDPIDELLRQNHFARRNRGNILNSEHGLAKNL